MRNKRRTKKTNKRVVKFYVIGISILFFLVCLSSSINSITELNASTKVVDTIQNDITGFVPTHVEAIQENTDDLTAFPFTLPGDYENRKTIITKYLELRNEDVTRWTKIIQGESGFNPDSEAQTYWSLCDRAVVINLWGYEQPANSFIELRDYPNGIWQATCEEAGANTIRTGVSKGLIHIIEVTWEETGCKGERTNWIDNLECGFKIRDNQGWKAWSTN